MRIIHDLASLFVIAGGVWLGVIANERFEVSPIETFWMRVALSVILTLGGVLMLYVGGIMYPRERRRG